MTNEDYGFFTKEEYEKLREEKGKRQKEDMTREVAIKAIQDFIGWFKEDSLIRKALDMAIQALEQMPEVTSTIYVPIRETKGISCSECKYFKVTQEPLRGTGGLIDLGQARCEKHDLITDFAHKGKFKHLKPCEYFVDFKERAESEDKE